MSHFPNQKNQKSKIKNLKSKIKEIPNPTSQIPNSISGANRSRTGGLFVANETLYQLSYSPGRLYKIYYNLLNLINFNNVMNLEISLFSLNLQD